MTEYRRAFTPGGSYFFTVNLAQRRNNNLLMREIGKLREAVRRVQSAHPFEIIAAVILPDHLHMIWRLPESDIDYPKRWNLIKGLSHADCKAMSRAARVASGSASAASGSDGTGSISSAMTTICAGMSNTSITTR